MAKTAHTIRISSFLEVLRLEGHGGIARIDELRGALILLVLIYHLLYDITLFFPAAVPRLWLLGGAIRPLRAVVPGLFILLCGMCTHLSRNNMRRGLWCALFAGGIRHVSGIVSPACPIRFGILHQLALCLLLWLGGFRALRGRETGPVFVWLTALVALSSVAASSPPPRVRPGCEPRATAGASARARALRPGPWARASTASRSVSGGRCTLW